MVTKSKALLQLPIKAIPFLALGACGFLPGFSVVETPLLYHLPVSEVAEQVACELQDVMADYSDYKVNFATDHRSSDETNTDKPGPNPRWYLASDQVSVTLTLQTDDAGYVTFTGVNPAGLGLATLEQFITSTTTGKISTPSLAAKISPHRTHSATLTFTVSPSPAVTLNSDALTSTNGVYFQKNEATGGSSPYDFELEFERDPADGLHSETNGFKFERKGAEGNVLIDPLKAHDGPFKYMITVTDSSNPTRRATQTVEGNIGGNTISHFRIYLTTSHCPEWARHPDHRLFLKTWLLNYFDKINTATLPPTGKSDSPCQANTAVFVSAQIDSLNMPCFPEGTQMTSVDLKTQFVIALDLSAGVAPTILGNGLACTRFG